MIENLLKEYESLLLDKYGVTAIVWADNKASIFNFKPDFPKITAEEISTGWEYFLKEAILSNQWINANFEKPQLLVDEESTALISKEIFFKVYNHGGIYHGWYIGRPIEGDEAECPEYEYFFNANVGDELFKEDHIDSWMIAPLLSGCV